MKYFTRISFVTTRKNNQTEPLFKDPQFCKNGCQIKCFHRAWTCWFENWKDARYKWGGEKIINYRKHAKQKEVRQRIFFHFSRGHATYIFWTKEVAKNSSEKHRLKGSASLKMGPKNTTGALKPNNSSPSQHLPITLEDQKDKITFAFICDTNNCLFFSPYILWTDAKWLSRTFIINGAKKEPVAFCKWFVPRKWLRRHLVFFLYASSSSRQQHPHVKLWRSISNAERRSMESKEVRHFFFWPPTR